MKLLTLAMICAPVFALTTPLLVSLDASATRADVPNGNWARFEANRSLAESIMTAHLYPLNNAIEEFTNDQRIDELGANQHLSQFLLKNLSSRLNRKDAANIETLNRLLQLSHAADRLEKESSESARLLLQPGYLELRSLPSLVLHQFARQAHFPDSPSAKTSGAEILASLARPLYPTEANFQELFNFAAAKGMISTSYDYVAFLKTYLEKQPVVETRIDAEASDLANDFELANLPRVLDLVGKFEIGFAISRIGESNWMVAMRVAEEAIRTGKLVNASAKDMDAFLTTLRTRTSYFDSYRNDYRRTKEQNLVRREYFKSLQNAAITHLREFKATNPSEELQGLFRRTFEIGFITYALPSKTYRPSHYDVESVVLAPSAMGPHSCETVFAKR